MAICAAECAAAIAEAATAGGPEPWEAKSSLRTRTSYDRLVYIRGYSDSKEVSFYPYLEPAYGPASLSSISYLSQYPAFSTLGSFR